MKSLYLFSILPLAACTPSVQVSPTPIQQATQTVSKPDPIQPLKKLSAAEKKKIGQQIWKNESGGKKSGLTHWNVGEEFPSMGIGHYIWYPKGFNGRWIETFPLFINYAKSKGTKNIPQWVLAATDCPWNSREAFLKDVNGPRLTGLREFMANTVELQTEFIVIRSRAALQKIVAAAPAADKQRVISNYQKVSKTPHGVYALIDYVNFKGDGTNVSERYKGQGWGMLQVLQNMKDVPAGKQAAREFAESAKRMLLRRVKNSPQTRGEKRWTAGWNNRCDTYAKPL